MISFRIVGNTGALADKIRRLEAEIDDFKSEILNEAAGVLVTQSPVDTGTYMDSFHVGPSGGGGFTTSKGKPRNQPYQPSADQAMTRMSNEIESIKEGSAAVFYNEAEHATEVEYEHGYAPFTTMRSRFPEIVARAASRVRK